MRLRMIRIVAIVGLICPSLWSQTGLPAPLTGNSVRSTLSGESKSPNTLTTTLRVSATADDNVLNNNSDKVADAITRFDPTFDWNLSRQRWSLESQYTPGFSYSLELPKYRTLSHDLSNDLSFMPVEHLNIRFRNSFRKTSDPYDGAAQSSNGFGVLDNSNPSLFGLPTLFTMNQSSADVSYMPARHTTIGASGTYSMKSYDDLVPGSSVNRDTHVASGRAFVDQKLSPRQSVSLAYDYLVVTSGVFGRTGSHSVLLFDSWQFNPNFTLSVFGGPQYTQVHYGAQLSALPLANGWSWSAGGTLAWHGALTGVSATAVRRISDGGGLGGAVQMTNFAGSVTRKLGRKTQAEFNAGYTLNGSNADSVFNRSIKYFSGGVTLTQGLTRNLSFDAHYSYSHQDRTTGIAPLDFLSDHNRFSVGFSYSFSHRMGM